MRGRLAAIDVILEKLNEFLDSTSELKEHVFSAMIYQVILLVTIVLSMPFRMEMLLSMSLGL